VDKLEMLFQQQLGCHKYILIVIDDQDFTGYG
jgi:hypothetical protein